MARYYYVAGQLVTVQDKEEKDFKTLNPESFPVRVFITKKDKSITLIQDPELNDFLALNKGLVDERRPLDLSVKPGKKIPGKPEPVAPPPPPTGDDLLNVGIGPKLKRDAEEALNPKPKPPRPKYELKAAPKENDIREWGLDQIDKFMARLGGYKTKEQLERGLVKVGDTPEEAKLKKAATTMPEQHTDIAMELFDWQTIPNKTPEQVERVNELLDRKYYIESHMEPFSQGMTPTQYQSKRWEQELSKNNTFIEKLMSAASYGALGFLTGNVTALDPGGEMSDYLTYGFQGLMSTLDRDDTGKITPKGKTQARLMSLAYSAPMTMTMMAAGAFSSGLTGITKAPALLKSVFSMVARGATLAQQEMMFAFILSQENKADYDAGRLTDTNFIINMISAAAQTATESLSFKFQTGAVQSAFRKGGLGALREMARKDLLKALTMSAKQFGMNALGSIATEAIEEGGQNIEHHLGNALKGDPLPSLDVWIPEIAEDMFVGGFGGGIYGGVSGVLNLVMNPSLVSKVDALSRAGWQSATYTKQALEQIKARDWDNFEATWQLAKETYATEQPDSPHLAKAMVLVEDAYRAQQSSDIMESDRTIHQAQVAQQAAQKQIAALERFRDAGGNFSDPKHAEAYREAVTEIREQQKIIEAATQEIEADEAKKAMYDAALRARVLEYRLRRLQETASDNPSAKEQERIKIIQEQVRAERAASMGERRFLRQMHLTPGEQSEIFTPQELEYIETGTFPDATHEGTTLYSTTPVEEAGIKSGKYSASAPTAIDGGEATPGSKIVFKDDAKVMYLDTVLSQISKKQLKEIKAGYDAVVGSDGEARIFNPDSVRSISEFTPQPAPAKTNTDRAHNRDLREANRQRVSEATHKLAAESILEMMKSHIKTTEHPDTNTTRVTFNDGRTLEINTKTGLIEARNDKGEVIHHQDGTTAKGVGQTYSVNDVKVVIELVEGYNGGNSTGFHEAFHAVWKLFLSSKQRAFVSRYYDAQGKAGKLVREISYGKDNKRVEQYWTAEEYAKMSKDDKLYWQEEGAAYGFEKWLTKRMADKTSALGRIWQKLADGIHSMMSRLGLIPRETDITGLFRQIAGDKLGGTGTLGARSDKPGSPKNTGINGRMYSRRTLWGTIDPAISRMLKQGRIGEATAKQYRKEAQQLEDLYKANPELEMVWAGLSLDYLDEVGVLRKNSDKTYKISADFGRECKKRIAFAKTISNVQKEMGRFLRPSEYVQIREALKAAGEEVPCHICYVDAGRISLGLKMERWLINTPDVPADVRKMLLGYEFYQFEMKYPKLYKKLNSYVAVQNTTLPTVFTDYGVKMGKKPAGEILRKQQVTIDALNAKGGLRAQSWSDWMPWQIMDWYQILIDAKAQDLKIQTYAKVPEFVEVFGNSGIMFNLSLIYKRTEDGKFVPDDIEGINYEKAQSLRDRFPKTVGTVAVAMSHEHMLQLMADPKVDYIIPYHISGNVKEARQMMGIGDWQDFTGTQSEHVIDKEKFEDSQFNGNKNDFHEWFVRREWWDINKTGEQNAQTYLSMCDKCGLEPVFSEYKDVPGYWKTLIEHKMYDNSGKGIVQTAVSPNIDMKRAKELLKNYKHDRSDRMDIVRISKFYTSVGEEMLGEEWMKAIAPNQITEGELLTKQQDEYCAVSALLVEDPEALTKKQASTLKSAITKMNQGIKAYLSVKIDGTPVNQLGKDKLKGYRFINGIVSGQTSEIGFLWEPLTEWVKNKVAESINWRGRIESISDMVSKKKDGAMFKLAPTRAELAEAGRQMEGVRKQYQGTDQWLKAPNGKPTNLTERQWLQVRTQLFKDWFGDWENDPKNASKVVDESGEPMVVYHGSNSDMDTYDWQFKKEYLGKNTKAESAKKAFFFAKDRNTAMSPHYSGINYDVVSSDIKAIGEEIREAVRVAQRLDVWNADEIAKDIDNGDPFIDVGAYRSVLDPRDIPNNIVEALENLRNGIEENSDGEEDVDDAIETLTNLINMYSDTYATEELMSDWLLVHELFLNIRNPNTYDYRGSRERAVTYADLLDEASDEGMDGAILYNTYDGGDLDNIYAVFEPTQIKSATANVGTFSNEDADIRYKLLPKSETPKKTITVVRMGYLNKDGTVSPVQVDGKTTRDHFDWGTWYKAEGRKSAMVPRWGFHSGYPENGASFDQLYRNDGTLDPERVYYLAEVGIDKSYQDQVDKTKTKDIRYGIPEGGYYHFWNRGKKNPPWIITDTMKPIRVLSWEEVDDLNRKAGRETVRGYPKDKYERRQGTDGGVAGDTRFRLFSKAGRDYVRGNRFGIVSEKAAGETDKVHQVPVNVVENPDDPPKQGKKPDRISAQEVREFAARMEEEHGFDKNEVIETVGRQLLTSMEHAHETIAGILTEARESTFPDEASARVPGYQEGESIHWSYQAMEEYADSMNMSVDEAVQWLMETRHDATAAGIKLFGRFKYVSDQLIEIYEQLETEDSQSKRAQLEKDLGMLISERDDLQVAMDRQSSMAGTILRTRGIQKQRMLQQLEHEAERLQRSVEADSQEIAAIKKELAELDEMLTALEKEYAAWKAAQQPKEHLKSKPGPRGESEGQKLLKDIASIKSRMATLTQNLQDREQHKRAGSSRSEEVKKQLEASKKKNGRARATDIKPKKLTLYDWWRVMFYNMILSGPPTHMINIGANLANSVFELAADNLSLPGIGLRGAGSALSGIPGGLKKAAETFKAPDDYAKKYEMGKSTNKLYNLLNVNLRLLSAEDAYFFSTNYRASLKSLAVFEARRTNQSAQFLYENPTADMIKQATYEARKMSFNHNPEGFVGILVDGIEKGYSAMENHFGLSGKVFAGLLRANIMPFVRIVANVVNTNIDYTPGLGLVRLAMYAAKKPNLAFEKQRGVWMNENRTARLSPYRVRDMRKQLARQAVGTILLSLLYSMAKAREEKDPDSWLISGSGPRDKEQRNQLMSMGWRPNSINIGGRAIPYVELPVGAVMAMLGNYLDFEKYNQSSVPIDQYKSLGYSVMGIAKAFMGRTFLTGLQTTIVAINTENPDWLMKQAASTAVSPFNWGLARFFSNMYDRDSHQPEGLQWFLYQLPVPPPPSVAHGVTYYGTHARQKHWLERFIGVPVAPAKDMPAGLADVVQNIRKAGNWVPVSGIPELRVGEDKYFTPRGRDLEIYKELRAAYLVELMLSSTGTIQELSALPTRPPLTKFLTKISTSATARAKSDMLEAYNTGQLIHKYKTYAKATKPLEMIDSSSLPVVEEPEEYEEENP